MDLGVVVVVVVDQERGIPRGIVQQVMRVGDHLGKGLSPSYHRTICAVQTMFSVGEF